MPYLPASEPSKPNQNMQDPQHEQDRPTPVPYPGVKQTPQPKYLPLNLTKTFPDSPFAHVPPFTPTDLNALLLVPCSTSRLPILNVMTFLNRKSHVQAILKLYDRRFGTSRRRDLQGRHVPHTPAREAAFRKFVREGKMAGFLRRLEEEEKRRVLPPKGVWEFLEEKEDAEAKYEAALWWECEKEWECEGEALERLRELQGGVVPRVYAYVKVGCEMEDQGLVTPEELVQQAPEDERYFEVKGILREWIRGYSLGELTTSKWAPSDPDGCRRIVQAAVDGVHEINKRGVLIRDCRPGSVVVSTRNELHMPLITDFSRCGFKDRVIKEWKESGWYELEEEDVDGWEMEWWEDVIQSDNPGSIGAVMRTKVLHEKAFRLDIEFPNCMRYIEEIECRKKAAELEGTDASTED